jgi:hypothetical protein
MISTNSTTKADTTATAASSTRLRARVKSVGPEGPDFELATLRRSLSWIHSQALRLQWRAHMRERTTRISVVLHRVRQAIALSSAYRQKTEAGWVFYALPEDHDTPLAVVQTKTPGRSLDDLRAPIGVIVYVPEHIDVRRLQDDERAGRIRLEMRGAPCP